MSSVQVRMRSLRASSQNVPWYWWAAAYFVILTVAMTWPLVLRMGNSVVGSYGDNLYYVWLIGWFEKANFVLHRSPLFTDLINYPEGWRLAGDEVTPAMVLAGLPFSLLGGPVLGYNASALLSFALSGFMLCWWVYRLTGRLLAGLIAGTLFAFSAYRVSHFIAGHLQLLGTQWLVLYFMSLYEALEPSPKSKVWPLAAGLSLGMVALTSQYYMYMTFVLTGLWVGLHVVVRGPRYVLRRAYALRLTGILLIAAPLVLLAEYPYFEAASVGAIPVRDAAMAANGSASPTDYLLPSNRNPLLGDWVDDHFDRSLWIEVNLCLGVAASIAALVAVAAPSESERWKGTRLHLVLLAMGAFVLSLGPKLRWFSGEVRFGLLGPLSTLGHTPSLPLPASLLYQYLPYYTSLRVPARYGVYVILIVCVLAGVGFAYLMSHGTKLRRMLLLSGLMAILVVELFPWRPRFVKLEGREVDHWLASQPGQGAVAQLPAEDEGTELLAYYTLIHGRPSVSGHDNLQTPFHAQLMASLGEVPDQGAIELLRSVGVRYIVVDVEWYDRIDAFDDLESALADLGLDETAAFEGYRVYTIDP